jgi:hypothetical protein
MPTNANHSAGADWSVEGEPDWDELVRAKTTYHQQQMLLFRSNKDPAPILRRALRTGTARDATYELADVAEHRPELVRALVRDLFPHTLGLDPVSGKARTTLGILDAVELRPILRP